jgi:hypothetical protein
MINAAELVAIALPVSVAATTALSTPTRIAAAALAGQEAQVAAQHGARAGTLRARLQIDDVEAYYHPEGVRGGFKGTGALGSTGAGLPGWHRHCSSCWMGANWDQAAEAPA